MRQKQFLDVVDEAEARRRFSEATAHLGPQAEKVPLRDARGRVLFEDAVARVDVPGFDRSNVDGFAVTAADTFGAEELAPLALEVAGPPLAAGMPPPEGFEVARGTAAVIATGGVLPRGADAVVMVEDTEPIDGGIRVSRPVAPGDNVTFAGSDIGRGEVVLRRGTRLTSRETGVLAAIGLGEVAAVRRPRVAVLSTGDEIVTPGTQMGIGMVADSNQRILLDAVAELGGEPIAGGILPDELGAVEHAVEAMLGGDADAVLLSGGTSKGEGDVNAEAVARLAARLPDSPGIVVHGVALKPGKPILLAVVAGKPVVVLPGFPTSAIFTFHEFVAPLLRRMAGLAQERAATVEAVVPVRLPSVAGRTQYTLVDLVEGPEGLAAYPLGAGSGSVTALARADGFVRIPDSVEYLAPGERVRVRLAHPDVRPADLVAIGSHCTGLDHLLGLLAERGLRVKSIPVGSTGGLAALRRGEGDVAGIHLMDPSGEYNTPFLPEGVRLLPGYGRRQGIAYRSEHAALAEAGDPEAFIRDASRIGLRMINRNPGSGTRVLLDSLLGGERPAGYLHQARTHHAVAAAVEQGRADWGMTLDTVAGAAGLEFLFVQDEEYDLAIPEDRWDRPAVTALRDLLGDPDVRDDLHTLGFVI